jgi:phosphoribosylformylglycinamidine cyclo-ligase
VKRTVAVDWHWLHSASGPAVIESLLTPTRLYGSLVQALLGAALPLHGMAHITGGGLPENLPRCLPAGLQARIDPASWERPELFRWLQEKGEVPEADLWHTFNLGVGYCLVLPEAAVDEALQVCANEGHQAWRLGVVEPGAAGAAASLVGLPA